MRGLFVSVGLLALGLATGCPQDGPPASDPLEAGRLAWEDNTDGQGYQKRLEKVRERSDGLSVLVLSGALSDENTDVRVRAAAALGARGPAAAEAVDALIAAL